MSQQQWGRGVWGGNTALTAYDIIYAAYRISGVLGNAGRGLAQSEQTEGLLVVNSMLDGWKAERLMVYAILRNIFSITPYKASYTIGPSPSDLTIQRPARIEMAGLVLTSTTPNIEEPLYPLNYQEWAALSPKGLQSTLPSRIYYEPEVPRGLVYLWPIPTVVNQFTLYTWQALNEFTNVNDFLVVPPAYRECMEYQLALRIAARYPERAKMSQLAIELARGSLAKVKTINAVPTLLMQTEAAGMGVKDQVSGTGRWSILTNQRM